MAVAHPAEMLATKGRALEQLFAESPAGTMPDGRGRGTVVFAPGTPLSRPVARLVRLFMWQGKVFDREQGQLLNLISPLRIRTVRAKVYRDSSLFDGQEAIVLDYSETSRIARWIRDEIREVSPGVYLGLVFLFGRNVMKFALAFPAPSGLRESRRRA